MKRRNRTLSIFFLLLGSILMIFSGYRWLQIYSDPSNAFFGMLIGGVIAYIGSLHQRASDHNEELEELHRAIDIQNQWITNEFKKFNLNLEEIK